MKAVSPKISFLHEANSGCEQMNNVYGRISTAFLIAFFALDILAGCSVMPRNTAENNPPPVPSQKNPSIWCSTEALENDDALANEIGVKVSTLALLKKRKLLSNEQICRLPRNMVKKHAAKYNPPYSEMPTEWGRWKQLRDLNDDGTYDFRNLIKANLIRESMTKEQREQGVFSAAGISLENWESLGPTTDIGGRVRALLIHPKDNKLIFAGSASGGIWVSKNRAESWERANKFQGNLAISSFAYAENCINDQGQPSEAIFAGTGEMETGQVGAGVQVSFDRGDTWRTIPGTSPWRTGETGILTVKKILVHPTDCRKMAILAVQGPINSTQLSGYNIWQAQILVSNDQGASWENLWKQSISSGKNLPVQPNRATDIELDPFNSERLLAVSDSGFLTYYDNWHLFPTNGVTRSKATYTPIRFIPQYRETVINPKIGVSRTAQKLLVISAGGDFFGKTSYVYNSKNYESADDWFEHQNFILSQPYYANSIAIDVTDSKSVLVGGLDAHQLTFREESNGELQNNRRISNWLCGKYSPHADIQIILQDKSDPNRIYFGTDGGVYSTDDVNQVSGEIDVPGDITDASAYEAEFNKRCLEAGKKWNQRNAGLSISQFYSASRIVVPGRATAGKDQIFIAGGLQDNGTVFYDATTTQWKRAFPGDGGPGGFSSDGALLFGTSQYLFPYRRAVSDLLTQDSNTGISIIATDQCGQDVDHPRQNQGGILEDSSRCQPDNDTDHWKKSEFIAPFTIVNGNIMYGLAAGHNLWRSIDLTATAPNWIKIFNADLFWKKSGAADSNGNFINNEFQPEKIFITAIGTNENSGYVYFGTNVGLLYRTKDIHATPDSVKWGMDADLFKQLAQGRITSIYVNPNDPDEIIVSTAGYLTLEVDTGFNLFFRERQGNGTYQWRQSRLYGVNNVDDRQNFDLLRTFPVYKVTRHPTNKNWIYAGTPVGVFVSEDKGVNWYASNQGPVNVAVEDLFWIGTDLYVATFGLGMFKSTTATTTSTDTLVLAPPKEIDADSDCVFLVAVKDDKMFSFDGKNWRTVVGMAFPSAYYVKEEGGQDWTTLSSPSISATKYPLQERSIQVFKPGEMAQFAGFGIWFAWGKSPIEKSGDSYFGRARIDTCVTDILTKTDGLKKIDGDNPAVPLTEVFVVPSH